MYKVINIGNYLVKDFFITSDQQEEFSHTV